MNITAELLSSIRCHITESFVMEILACSFAQKKFTKSLIERALGQPISEDAYIHLDDGTAVKMKHVFAYPYTGRKNGFTSIANMEKIICKCHIYLILLNFAT